MNRAEQTALVWALTDSAKPILTIPARLWLHATIGAGDIDDALRELLAVLSKSRAPLEPELYLRVGFWVAGYSGSTVEATLVELMKCIPINGDACPPADQPLISR